MKVIAIQLNSNNHKYIGLEVNNNTSPICKNLVIFKTIEKDKIP